VVAAGSVEGAVVSAVAGARDGGTAALASGFGGGTSGPLIPHAVAASAAKVHAAIGNATRMARGSGAESRNIMGGS
jgi:hypothetical protein